MVSFTENFISAFMFTLVTFNECISPFSWDGKPYPLLHTQIYTKRPISIIWCYVYQIKLVSMSSNRQNKQPEAIPSIAIFSDLESYVIQHRLAFRMLITKVTTETSSYYDNSSLCDNNFRKRNIMRFDKTVNCRILCSVMPHIACLAQKGINKVQQSSIYFQCTDNCTGI